MLCGRSTVMRLPVPRRGCHVRAVASGVTDLPSCCLAAPVGGHAAVPHCARVTAAASVAVHRRFLLGCGVSRGSPSLRLLPFALPCSSCLLHAGGAAAWSVPGVLCCTVSSRTGCSNTRCCAGLPIELVLPSAAEGAGRLSAVQAAARCTACCCRQRLRSQDGGRVRFRGAAAAALGPVVDVGARVSRAEPGLRGRHLRSGWCLLSASTAGTRGATPMAAVLPLALFCKIQE